MKTRVYLLIAFSMFVTVVTGSDLIARTSIAGHSLADALAEHLRWVSLTAVGILVLFAPFGGAAVICGRANTRCRTRSATALFAMSMLVLGNFYFNGFQASQHAVLEGKWTAATLSVAMLPVFVGIPLLVIVAIAATIAVRFDPPPA